MLDVIERKTPRWTEEEEAELRIMEDTMAESMFPIYAPCSMEVTKCPKCHGTITFTYESWGSGFFTGRPHLTQRGRLCQYDGALDDICVYADDLSDYSFCNDLWNILFGGTSKGCKETCGDRVHS